VNAISRRAVGVGSGRDIDGRARSRVRVGVVIVLQGLALFVQLPASAPVRRDIKVRGGEGGGRSAEEGDSGGEPDRRQNRSSAAA